MNSETTNITRNMQNHSEIFYIEFFYLVRCIFRYSFELMEKPQTLQLTCKNGYDFLLSSDGALYVLSNIRF